MLKDIVLVALALLGFIALIFNVQSRRGHESLIATGGSETARKSCYCGESTKEARDRGCKYDSLCAAWLPEHCRNDELTAEFETLGDGADGNWLYWADKNHTILLTVDEVAELGNDPNATFHMSSQWHITHCFYLWRLEHRTRFNGKFVEARSDSEEHILHCLHVVQNPQFGVVAGVTLDADYTGQTME